jgi:PIN domain nuclease of toxin-antitoxin system
VIVLDSSALLAWIYREPGHERVFAAIPHSAMTTVNLAEVLSRFVRDGRDVADIGREFAKFPIEWVDFNRTLATMAAGLTPETQPHGLSLGDRACIALGISRRAIVMTADRVWARLKLDVEIEVIR